MFTRQHALRVVVVTGLATAAGLLLAPTASSMTAPDRSAEHALTTLVTQPATVASSALPQDFQDRFGYQPTLTNGLLGDPSGECSSPVPLPEEFTAACRQHDLGYDLLRYAGRSGRALAPDARRAVDTQLGVEFEQSCTTREEPLSRATCLAWADIAEGFVRINSARQGYAVPESETAMSIAPGISLGVAGLGALGLAVGTRRPNRLRARNGRASAASWSVSGTKSIRNGRASAASRSISGTKAIRSALQRVATAVPPLPRASTALATPLALGAATFPSFLPQQPVALGVLGALSFLVVFGLTRRLAGPRPHLTGPARRVAGVAGGALTAYIAYLAVSTQNGMRTRIGMDPLSLRDIGVAAATAATVVGFVHGVRWVWHRRARLSRPAVAAVAGLSLLSFAPSAQADAGEPVSDQVLLTQSPVGAVRAYAGVADSADTTTRARIAVDRLVAAGGLAREHLLVAIPTGSGWVNPEFVAGTERRFGADVATVSMQYDTRPSWVAFLVNRDGAIDGARALLDAVTAEVSALPEAKRPQVHVVGESLGATAGLAALRDPGAGDVRRVVCSTFWLGIPGGDGRTGLPRETIAANADDPVVHASPTMLFTPTGEGRPWLPVVSFVHAGADFIESLAVPAGSGHRYGSDQPDRLQTCD